MYTITQLAGVPNGYATESSAINASGDVCGGVSASDGSRGAVWSSFAPWAPVLLASGSNSYFYGLNAAGAAVGATGMDNTSTQRACLFRGGQLIDLFGVVGEYSIGTGINGAGRVVGWRNQNYKARGFVYESVGGGLAFIDPLPGTDESLALAVNESGAAAGLCGTRAFLYADGALTDVGVSTAGFVCGINAGRRIVGSVFKPQPAAYAPVVIDASLPTPTAVELPPPPGAIGSHGNAINDAGVVVGTSWTEQTADTQNQRAYVYANGVSQDLNALIPPGSGWHLESANGVNNAGQIVCDGTYLGQMASAVLTPVSPFALAGRVDKILAAILFGGVAVDGGGWVIVGGKPIPVGPWGPLVGASSELTPERRDVLVALAAEALAGHITSVAEREALRRSAVEAARAGLDRLLSAPPVPPASAAALVPTAARRRMRDRKRVI
jgi:probable HAF family extracellular repeat protein